MKKLCLTLLLGFLGCNEVITRDLSEERAGLAAAILAREGIPVTRERDGSGWSISVPTEHSLRAVMFLRVRRFFREDRKRESSGFLPSKEERQRARERDVAEDIQRSLISFPGILETHVHLVLEPHEEKSGSVLLIRERGAILVEADIRRLVAGAAGIPEERIHIVSTLEEPAPPVPNLTGRPRSPELFLALGGSGLVIAGYLSRRKR